MLATPTEDYVGFYHTRGTPFFKATGNNEIEVRSYREGVRCWWWGNLNGIGSVIDDDVAHPFNYYLNW